MMKAILRLLSATFLVALLAACAAQPPTTSWAPPAPVAIGGPAPTSEPQTATAAQWEALGMPAPPTGFTWKGCRRTHGFLGQSKTPQMEGCELVPVNPESAQANGQQFLVNCWQPSWIEGGYWKQETLPYQPSSPPQCQATAPMPPYYGGVPYGYGPPIGYGPAPQVSWGFAFGGHRGPHAWFSVH